MELEEYKLRAKINDLCASWSVDTGCLMESDIEIDVGARSQPG